MPRRLFALAVVALALVGSAGCANDVSPALRVGSLKIGNDEFLAEVAEWVGNPVAVDPATVQGQTPGTYPLELVRQLMQQRIDFSLHNAKFAELGLVVDDAARQQALTVLFGDPSFADQAFSAFSPEFATSFTDDVARQIGVSDFLGELDYSTWRDDAYKTTDIEVSPRYGTWDPETGQITPPPGPRQPTSPLSFGP